MQFWVFSDLQNWSCSSIQFFLVFKRPHERWLRVKTFCLRLCWFVFHLYVLPNTSRSVIYITGINFSFRILLVSLFMYTRKHNQYQDYVQDFNSFTGHIKGNFYYVVQNCHSPIASFSTSTFKFEGMLRSFAWTSKLKCKNSSPLIKKRIQP